MPSDTQAVLDQATADINAMDDVVDSVLALIDTLVAQVKANINDPTALKAALVVFEAKKQALADAVAANTPAA